MKALLRLWREKLTAQIRREVRAIEPHPALAYCLLKHKSVKMKKFSAPFARWEKVLLVVCLMVEISVSAQVLPSNRTPGGTGGWYGLVGVPGGIPYRTNIYTTIAAGASVSTVQTAINNCPSNSVVYLSAGTYNWSSSLNMKSGVTVRGAGPGITIINSSANNAIYFGGYNCMIFYQLATGSGVTRVNWTGGYTQGTNVITLSSTSGLSVGQNIWVDQLNDADTTGGGAQGTTPGCYSTPSYPSTGQDRTQFQMDLVTAINGNNVTLSEPIYMPNWNSANSPGAWWESVGFPMSRAGIEDFTLNCTSGAGANQSGVWGDGVYACWMRNVTFSGWEAETLQVGMRCEIRHCALLPPANGVDDYGYYPKFQFGSLYVDNIADVGCTPFLIQGCAGLAIAYNYVTNLQSRANFYLGPGYDPHGGNPNMILFEGNWGPSFGADNTWSSSAYNTGLRNRFVGAADSAYAASGNVEAVDDSETCHHMSIIGNVLGTTGYNTIYQETPSTCTGNPRVYWIGGTSGCSGTNDPSAQSTLITAYNWTSATSTNNGIVLDGYQASQIPNSLYLTSEPTNFGILKWPPVNPANPAYSMSRTNIPAGYRFVYGVDPPASGLTTPPQVQGLHIIATNSVPTGG